MIKTLRTTSVLVVIAAAVLIKYFVLPMVVGAGGDERVDKVLESPTVVEQFKETMGVGAKSKVPEISPLVKQADAFARYLTPVKPPGPRPPRVGGSITPQSLRATTPKFKVFATTYFEGNPELSQALIDEPGRDRRWVRQSSTVGGLLIEQVKDGVVVVKSSEDTYEIPVETNPNATPVMKTSPVSKATTATTAAKESAVTRPSPTYRRPSPSVSRTPSRPPAQQSSATLAQREKRADELVERLRALQKSRTPADRSRIDQLIATFKPSTVSPEDAESLTKLGEKVKSGAADPNRTKSDKIDTGAAKTPGSSTK